MIWNVIDCRKRPFRWKKVNAIIEATWHDNTVADSDSAPPSSINTEVVYEARECISLHEAIGWANNQTCPVTLYLYDEGGGV
jgi:hypothetical protein